MSDISTLVAVTTKKDRRFLKASASADWVKAMKLSDPEEARAAVVERAYKLLELQRLAGSEKITASSFHFVTRPMPGAGSLIPNLGAVGAVSNWCCICNDANPPECACVPC